LPDERGQYWQALKSEEHLAVEIMVDKYYPALLNFLLRLGCSRSDAEDIIQETFIKAIQNINHYRHQERFPAWLFKICHNNFKDFNKKASRRREIPHAPRDLPGSDGPSPESQAIMMDEALRVQAALNLLPPKQHLAVVLRFYHGFTFKEIAYLMSCPTGTVKSRLNHALTTLNQHLQEVDCNE